MFAGRLRDHTTTSHPKSNAVVPAVHIMLLSQWRCRSLLLVAK
jgi:hypothetical protein